MRKIIVMGSVGAGMLLVLAMFSAIVSAQTLKSNEIQTNVFQQIREKITNGGWQPGEIIGFLAYLFILLLILIFSNPGAP